MARTTAQKRFSSLEAIRDPFLQRAKDCAELTIPALMPYWVAQGETAKNHTGANTLPTPWQGVGARGVNNLASKLLLALLPPEAPFFKLSLDPKTKQEIMQVNEDPDEDKEGVVGSSLESIQRDITNEIEVYGIRSAFYEVALQLISSGSVLLHLHPDKPRVFKLNEFVCKRNSRGDVQEIITREWLARSTLDPMLAALVDGADAAVESPEDKSAEDNVALYTWVRRRGKKFMIHQEIAETVIPNTMGRERVDESSWLALRLVKVDGEDYARSYVEEYLGDLRSLDILSQALTEGAAASAKILWLVNPGGTTDAKRLARAPNGAFVPGDARDITSLQAEKFADMKVADERASKLERRLSAVFLLTSEMPRDAERVTAEEIRLIADELENALGGAYSLFTREFQAPLVKWAMKRLRTKGVLEPIITKEVEPKIVTGLEALGRNNELRRLDLLVQGAQAVGPEAVAEYVKVGAWLARRATALNIDMEGVLRSEEDVQRARRAKMEAEREAALGPEIIRQAGAQAQGETTQ